jgi:hypothetical protein
MHIHPLGRVLVWRARQVTIKSRYRNGLDDIPVSLFWFWKNSARFAFEGIPQDALFFARACEGLMMFFDCVARSGRPCALPSRAADSIWHAWARFDPDSLDAFCRAHFGRAIAHVDGASISAQMEQELIDCLEQARIIESMPVSGTSVPALFALDRSLRMPGGFGYRVVCGELAFSTLDQRGRPEGDVFYPGTLVPVELMMAGLITQATYDAHVSARSGPVAWCNRSLAAA